MLVDRHRSLYAAFDRFPSRKGAAIHIARFAPTLFDHTGSGILVVLGGGELPAHQVEENVEIVRHVGSEPNFLDRARGFGRTLNRVLDEAAASLEIIHFRDPWSGVPIVTREATYRTVFEVNGLPSIELPYLFPSMAPGTKVKIEAMERLCLERADRIVTPSRTTRDLLVSRGVSPRRINVIPNGADIPDVPVSRPVDAPERYIIYLGALQPWQGADTLLRALARLADLDLFLVICSSNHSRHARRIARFAEKLEISDRVIWKYELGSVELTAWLANALASIAPLRDCDRNAVQGCSPLKVIESMAAGVAVIASDLPPVREIVEDDVDGVLVPADRPATLARAVRILSDYPERAQRLGIAGRRKIASAYQWQDSLNLLSGVYGELGSSMRTSNGRGDVEVRMEGP